MPYNALSNTARASPLLSRVCEWLQLCATSLADTTSPKAEPCDDRNHANDFGVCRGRSGRGGKAEGA
eukprot:5238559-Pyramimonas_sp.AAC.1